MHTYSIVNVHVVFATWSRQPSLTQSLRPELHAFIAGTARNLDVANVHVGGVEDHVHLLGRFDPRHALSEVVAQIKKTSGDWMRDRLEKFHWQRGYSAFAVSHDRVRSVERYIARQEEHHRRREFREEMDALCREAGITVDDLGIL